jgi:hypothetical protein
MASEVVLGYRLLITAIIMQLMADEVVLGGVTGTCFGGLRRRQPSTSPRLRN